MPYAPRRGALSWPRVLMEIMTANNPSQAARIHEVAVGVGLPIDGQ